MRTEAEGEGELCIVVVAISKTEREEVENTSRVEDGEPRSPRVFTRKSKVLARSAERI